VVAEPGEVLKSDGKFASIRYAAKTRSCRALCKNALFVATLKFVAILNWHARA
jgi:hypothetical protein